MQASWRRPPNRATLRCDCRSFTEVVSTPYWILEGGTKTHLSDIFSIHEMTAYLTKRQIGDTRPNCEAAWNKHVSYSIDWKKVWKSLGTPLSDATEEKTWRKLLHRAMIFVRNRNPEAPSKLCRLDHCSCIESMHHLAQCHVTAPLWLKVIAFLNSLPNYNLNQPPEPWCVGVSECRAVSEWCRGSVEGSVD